MKHTIEISGGGSVTRDKPPVEGQPLKPGDAVVVLHILSERRKSPTETVWRVELGHIKTRQRE